MDRGIKLSHQICIKVLVELHDPEDVQLRAHLKSLPKVVRILLHKGNIDGANINKKILLGFDHIKVDGILGHRSQNGDRTYQNSL